MSASAATIIVGTCRPRTSALKSKSFAIPSPTLSRSRPKSSGRGATFWYSWYIGVSFMNSAAAALTWPCWASISAGIASRRIWAETLISLLILSGYFTAVKNATPPPSE